MFLHNRKVRTKMKIFQERKQLLAWNKKQFSSFSKDFQLLEIISDPRVGLQQGSKLVLCNILWNDYCYSYKQKTAAKLKEEL